MDYKRLLTQVERTLEQIDTSDSLTVTVAQIGETIAANFRDELGITGGRVYEARDDAFELVGRFGQQHEGELNIEVPKDYKPIELVLENGIVVMDPTDPGFDPVSKGSSARSASARLPSATRTTSWPSRSRRRWAAKTSSSR